MFAVAALLCFVLALFHVQIAGLDLTVLGLALVAAHLAFGWPVPWVRRP